MTIEIVNQTNFSDIEDAIELFAYTASGIPLRSDGSKPVLWEGWDFSRTRPYILVSKVSNPFFGQPWESQETVTESGTSKIKTTYNWPFDWSIQFTAYTDAYTENESDATDRTVNRETADRFIQTLISNAYLPSVRIILSSEGLAYRQRTNTIIPNVLPNIDQDKYIHQASIEYVFSGVAVTNSKDTDFFTTITDPFLNLDGLEQLLTTESGFILTTEAGDYIVPDYLGA